MLVVGGGIYGLTIAYDAAQRGLSVALIDRGDFGAATSFNHLKTIHGGLRYLQSADFRRMRESIRERRAFARIAPRWVAPLAFAMPTGASLTRNPMAMRAALAIDALVGRDRNDGVDPARHLPAGRIVAGAECRELFDGAIRTVPSAAVWHDYQTVNGDRLTLAFAHGAAAHGAVLANYAEATSPLRRGGKLVGVQARDMLTGQTFDIRARMLVNAAGPWAATVFDGTGVRPRWPLAEGDEPGDVASCAQGRARRSHARRARARDAAVEGANACRHQRVTRRAAAGRSDRSREEVNAFLADINETFPALGLRPDEVTLVHRGIVPAAAANGRMSLLAQSRIIDHGDAGGTRELISIVGVKYTTARVVAERAVDLVLRKLERKPVECRTAETVLPGAGMNDRDHDDPVAHAMREEMAQTLSDVVIRRTGLGAAGYPGDQIVADVANRMQMATGWSDERKQRECEALKSFYEVL